MTLIEAVKRYKTAVEALHTVHSSTDVHEVGGIAGAAITQHCALICPATGDSVEFDDDGNLNVVKGNDPHFEVRREYEDASSALGRLLLAESQFPFAGI